MRVTRDGRRLFVPMNHAGKIAMFDISKPDQPRLLKALDLDPGLEPALCRSHRQGASGRQ